MAAKKHSKQRVRLSRQATAYRRLAAKAFRNHDMGGFKNYSAVADRLQRQAERLP